MEDLSITKVEIDNCELIDSRVINVFKNEFFVHVENIGFKFEFLEDKEDSYSVIDKVDDPDFNLYWVKLYNFNTGKIHGFCKPLSVGEDDKYMYHFSLAGIARENTDYRIVSFNLFREPKNGKN
ncbi:MAG: hypothetical protein LBH71_00100 [Oscillospiraceae bacterium]|jgi:hypothetical protein|nr:hypothetical protein [Oscillospiraceae bacterium]